jgi:hypothetical protein
MDDASETFDKTTFDYVRARRAMDAWVDHLNDKHVNWAWEILMGTAEVYASFTGHPIEQGRASIWCDFFDAWQNGSANLGILGILQELACACPDEHDADLERIMDLAREAGLTGKSVPRDLTWCMTKTRGTKGRPVATEAQRARAGVLSGVVSPARGTQAAPAQGLRLVAGEGRGEAGTRSRPSRDRLRLLPGKRPLAGEGLEERP